MISPDVQAELAAAIYDNAVAHGFWDEPRDFGEQIALIVSELSEALDEHRKSKPLEYKDAHSPFCSTAAWWSNWGEISFETSSDGTRFYKEAIGGRFEIRPDSEPPCDSVLCKPEGIAVELADAYIRILDSLHPRGVLYVEREWDLPSNFGAAITEITGTLGAAYINHKGGSELGVRMELAYAARQIQHLAAQIECEDFEGVVRRKHAFNRTRPKKHERAY